ncbi:hypothetical protein [Sulfurimonas sp.]|uniref:hypothetical protein n=1 Tax=Sulfurimonas sp. TaxID=2022749 RepID=UPI00356724E6
MKSILFILLVALISLEANTHYMAHENESVQVPKNGLGYSYEVNKHFEPFVYLNNKLQDMKMNFKDFDLSNIGIDIGVSGDLSNSFSYFFKYSSTEKMYYKLKDYYEHYSTLKQDTMENSKIYLGLNIRF